MLSPLPRHSDGRSCFAHPFRRISLPRKGHRVGLCIGLFEASSAFTRVTACTLVLPPEFVARYIEGFSHFVTSMTAPITSGWSISPGGPFTHWKAPSLHGAHPFRPVSFPQSRRSAKPRFCEVECSRAAVADLTLPAKSRLGRRSSIADVAPEQITERQSNNTGGTN